MANHALPTTASTYANFVTELQARIDDAVKESSSATVTLTNPPTNMVRWNATNFYWEINTGTPAAPTWGVRSARYDININGTVGATTANSGAFTTLTASTSATLPSSTTIGGATPVTATNTVTLTNKTLTAPVISSIVNGAFTLTIPSVTDTLVGKTTTDILTNKTLTAARITSASSIQDSNGAILIAVPTAVASAVNYLTINNSVSGAAPSIVATSGTDANLSLNLVSKGTGVVQANGLEIVNLSGTQTLTNKTLTAPVISSISNSGTITIPTGTDTLVSRASTDTLTNKTWNGATIGLAYGGTGATSAQAAINALAGSVTSGYFLRGNGTNILMSAIAAGDIPLLNQNTTGSAASLSATLAVGSGGTGATTAQGAINNLAGSVTSGYFLRGNGTNILMSAIAAGDIPLLNQNTTGTAAGLSATLAVGSGGTGQTSLANVAVGTATNLAGGVAGGIPYQSAAGTTSMLGAGTSGQVLKSGGSGAPTWGTAGSLLNVQVFTASGTYTPTAGTGKAWVEVLGGGGAGGTGSGGTQSGGGNITYYWGSPGAGGTSGCLRGILVSSPTITTVTVGAGGGLSAFGTLITNVGTGTTGTGGAIIRPGSLGIPGQGGGGVVNNSAAPIPGQGGGPGGGQAGGGAATANSGGGGGGGQAGNSFGYGTAAGAGGAGGSGIVIVYEYI